MRAKPAQPYLLCQCDALALLHVLRRDAPWRRRDSKTSVNPDTSGACTDSRALTATFVDVWSVRVWEGWICLGNWRAGISGYLQAEPPGRGASSAFHPGCAASRYSADLAAGLVVLLAGAGPLGGVDPVAASWPVRSDSSAASPPTQRRSIRGGPAPPAWRGTGRNPHRGLAERFRWLHGHSTPARQVDAVARTLPEPS